MYIFLGISTYTFICIHTYIYIFDFIKRDFEFKPVETVGEHFC